jgi:hypothetical protein
VCRLQGCVAFGTLIRVSVVGAGQQPTLGIRTHDDRLAVNPEEMPLFSNEIECRATEHRFGGVVVQPLEAWPGE